MTAAWHYHAPDGTFRKVLPAGDARRELAGRQAVAGVLPVPRLLDVRHVQDGAEIVYEDVFASGRCTGLLADWINAADRHPSHLPVVRALVNQVCDSLLAATAATGAMSMLEACVPDLHLARLAPGGRLDRWYTCPLHPAWLLGGHLLSLDDLAGRTLVAGGREIGCGWPVNLPELQSVLAGRTRWVTAVTQGDVTEPNIAQPLCWLDFEHAGRNALASDTANFLWYLLGMGGWLVPTYQPGVYARTLRTPVPPVAAPVISHLRVTPWRIEIDYTWKVGVGRHAAIATLLHRLAGDLGAALGPTTDVAADLRPFLAVRILGVISLRQMSGPHALTCLVKLAELAHPGWNLPGWCSTVPASLSPSPHPVGVAQP
ncbi:MAG TPA: hypothetical protein VKS82_04050 [Streptosporangiaceae bacterium]|nr:hypothetical protein [Streptosporangiaceae bacterium]